MSTSAGEIEYERSGFDMVEFGEQLRRAREEKGMTQQSLAEQLYVTRQSVSRWECGDRYPDLLTTKKISQILEVSLDDLLSGKEMTKVVERNPVIENKVANNIMIVLYAFVVLSYLIAGIGDGLRCLAVESFEDIYAYDIGLTLVVMVIANGISMMAFCFGLLNAVKGSLSPKRMGAVLVAYYIALFIMSILDQLIKLRAGNTGAYLGSWKMYVIVAVILTMILPGIMGSISSYFFFVRSQNRKIWMCLIAITSVIEIFRVITSLYVVVFFVTNDLLPDQLISAEYNSFRAILSIAVYVLILYQTYTLYKKRVAALEIANNSK